MNEVLNAYNNIIETNKKTNQFEIRREQQLAYWLEEEVRNKILLELSNEKGINSLIKSEIQRIISGDTGFYTASKGIIEQFLGKK